MSRRLLVPAALFVSALALAACAPATSASSPTSSATTAPSATPTPEEQAHLVVTVDGLELVDGSDAQSAGFDDAAALLALLEQATGTLPAPTEVESAPGYEMALVNYDWEGLKVIADESGTGFARVIVTAPEIDGIAIATADGFAVGSTRESLVAAGAEDVFDEDGDGLAEQISMGDQQVPGTTSLTHPGQVGVQYLMFTITDDVVTRIHAPADDFSDL